jgi:hypothetical protein
MLESGSISCSRIDLPEDPFEGALPSKFQPRMDDWMEGKFRDFLISEEWRNK